MGLDMHLTRRVHLANYTHDPDGLRLSQAVLSALGVTNPSDYAQGSIGIDLPAMYWRKANAVHAWFVNNIQGGDDNCGEHYVSAAQLTGLRNLCAAILAGKEPRESLPPQAGFFFGSADYDEGYQQDLLDTVAGIDRILAESAQVTQHDNFYYRSSW